MNKDKKASQHRQPFESIKQTVTKGEEFWLTHDLQGSLGHMSSTELATNLFRATQAEDKLKRDHVQSKNEANKIHYDVGQKIRETIESLGGTMPEELPTPEESILKITKEQGKLARDNNGE